MFNYKKKKSCFSFVRERKLFCAFYCLLFSLLNSKQLILQFYFFSLSHSVFTKKNFIYRCVRGWTMCNANVNSQWWLCCMLCKQFQNSFSFRFVSYRRERENDVKKRENSIMRALCQTWIHRDNEILAKVNYNVNNEEKKGPYTDESIKNSRRIVYFWWTLSTYFWSKTKKCNQLMGPKSLIENVENTDALILNLVLCICRVTKQERERKRKILITF